MRPKNRGAASLILALTVVSIAGCGDKNIKQLTPGIARDSVLKLLALGSTPAPGDTTPNVYREANQPRVVPDGPSVSIVNVGSEAEALPWAREYCEKRGKVPGPGKTMRFRSRRATWDRGLIASMPPREAS